MYFTFYFLEYSDKYIYLNTASKNYIAESKYIFLNIAVEKKISRQSLKRFTFRVKSSDSISFLLGLSPIVNLFDILRKTFKPFTWNSIF